MTITSNYWNLSERLLSTLLPIIIVISCAILFVLVSVYFTHRSMVLAYIIMGIIVLNIGVFLFIFHYTQPYRDLGKNASYKNREYTPSVLGNVSYSNMDVTDYSLEDIDKTSQLPFYSIEEHTSVDGLTYLGKDEDLYFFKDDKRDVVYNLETTSELVRFSSDLESNVDITTKTAKLNDPSFIKNGFKKEVGPTITSILVNKELEPIYYRHHVPTKNLKKCIY